MTRKLEELGRRLEAGSRRKRHLPHWREARHALKRLLDDPDATENAFAVFRAMDPGANVRRLRRMVAHPEGRRLLVERPRLLERLEDRNYLSGLPDGSFGRAYLEHIERHRLDPAKLVSMERELRPPDEEVDATLDWYNERKLLMHDLWHVLSGYGADDLGEAALLPFSWAQEGGRANAMLTLGAAFRAWDFPDREWPRYLWRAWRRGRRAMSLNLLPYEELLAEPLDDVRRAAGIDPPERAHPEGVRKSDRVAKAAA